ncbi:MAG TPA: exosortase/archaeosortase family protein [Gemmatimonadaceae bacterium]|nr:exosortase/archaeosortase family protein [Gemmatimonadaceae bacterium]
MQVDTSAPGSAGYTAGSQTSAIGVRPTFAALASIPSQALIAVLVTAVAFAILFAKPATLLAHDWWTSPEAGHGLLLAPVAIWLAWRSGIAPGARPNRAAGIALLVIAVIVRCAAGLAAELFTMRGSMVLALAGLTAYQFGFRQVLRWWLPFALICLSIPLPELITQALALPLQFKASQMGAAMLEMRNVPVRLAGNVIHIPGRELFVTEACSGLRSLTALISMAVLMGALVLRTPAARVALLLLAIPIAVVINGVRVFLTGFLVYFVDPAMGEGFMHKTEGWLLFLVSMVVLGTIAWLGSQIERLVLPRKLQHV